MCRYPNLDFGWKKSIDSKAFISCPGSCGEHSDHCKHGPPLVTPSDPTEEPPSPEARPPRHENCNAPDEKLEPASPPPSDPHPAPSQEGQGRLGDCVCSENLINGTGAEGPGPDTHKAAPRLCQCSAGSLPRGEALVLTPSLTTQTTTSVPEQSPPCSGEDPAQSPALASHECKPDGTPELRHGLVEQKKKPTSDRCPAIATAETTTVTTATTPTPTLTPSSTAAPSTAPSCEPAAEESPKTLGPNPGLILQALTLSNASDGFNLERLEMLGDSFLKHAITTYLFCTYPDAHEGRLSYMRSKKVS